MHGTSDYVPEQTAMPVEIRLADGTLLKGKLMVRVGKGIVEMLNGPNPFIDFEDFGGNRSYVAKAQIALLRLLELAKPAQLDQRLNMLDDFEPHKILGVSPGAEPGEIHKAYLRMAKGYHPDCFANVELPSEVQEYLAGMIRRINAAYSALEATPSVPRTNDKEQADRPRSAA
jgi:hypothetical protein